MLHTIALILFYGIVYLCKRIINWKHFLFLVRFVTIGKQHFNKILVLGIFLIGAQSAAVAQWHRLNGIPALPVTALESKDGKIYAATFEHLYTSFDGGNTWQISAPFPQTDDEVTDIFIHGEAIYVAMLLGGMNISTDGGINWHVHNDGLTGSGATSIFMLAQRGNSLYAATNGSGVFVKALQSPESPWKPFNTNISWGNINSIVEDDGTLFAGAGANSTLAFNTANSSTWNEIGFDVFNGEINALLGAIRDGNTLIGGGIQGLYRSTDHGLHWTRHNTGLGLVERTRFARWQGQTVALLSKVNGSFLRTTTDQGLQWSPLSPVMPGNSIGYDLAADTARLYCARFDGLWVLAPTVSAPIPVETVFDLGQAFPNPATGAQITIPFQLDQSCSGAMLRVYDLQGHALIERTMDNLSAGKYLQTIDLHGFANGMYLYNLVVDGRMQTREFYIESK